MKALQYFSDQYLEQCKKMTTPQIVQFLEDFRLLHSGRQKNPTKLISIKVPERLLQEFKSKAQLKGVKYQTQIKTLMQEWTQK